MSPLPSRLLLFFCAACLLSSASQPPETITAQSLLYKWASAIGGVERLAAVRNYHTRAQYRGTAGEGTVEEWATSTGQRRQVNFVDGFERIIVFDGTRGWTNEPGHVRPMSRREITQQKTPAYIATFSHLVPGRLPGVARYLGRSPEGHYMLEIGPVDGNPDVFFLDPQTFLPVRMLEKLVSTDLEIRFEDWKEFDGIRVPGVLRLIAGEGRYQATETLGEARFNVAISENLFAAPPQTSGDYTFTAGRSRVTVPMLEAGGYVIVQVSVNGSKPVWAALDTGASGSLIDAGLAERLRLAEGRKVQVQGAGGPASAGTVSIRRLQFPGVEIRNLRLQSLSLGFISNRLGRPVEMILGFDLFSRFVVELDYDRQRVTLFEPAKYSWGSAGLPINLHQDQPHLDAVITTPGGKQHAGEFVLDTGSGFSVMLSRQWTEEQALSKELPQPLNVTAAGVGGAVQLDATRTAEISLDGHRIQRPVALMTSAPIAAPGVAGNIGGHLLRRFRVTFDYSRLRVGLQPGRRFSEPDEYDMSGISLESRAPFERVQIASVRAGSPAAAAGLQAGDQVVSMAGKTLRGADLPRIRTMLTQAGSTVRLRVRRDGKILEKQIELRRAV